MGVGSRRVEGRGVGGGGDEASIGVEDGEGWWFRGAS